MNKLHFPFLIRLVITASFCIYFSCALSGQVTVNSKEVTPSLTIFLMDGLSNAVFKELLANDQIPTIDSLINNGLYVENGIISFPSMTGYSFYPFLTGVDAAESGITGLRWFDRSRFTGNLRNYVGRSNVYMNEDLRSDVKTLFEYFPDYFTASINSYCNRGAKESLKTGWALTTSKYGSDKLFGSMRKIPIIGKKISKNNLEHENLVIEKALEQLAKDPKIHWITFPSADGINHISGTTAAYREAIMHIDRIIGMYIAAASEDKTQRIYAIVSDHGVRDVHHNIRVEEEILTKTRLNIHRGKSTNLRKMQLDDPISLLDPYDGHLVINGNLSAYLYMKNKDWSTRTLSRDLHGYPMNNKTVDIPKALVEITGIDFICYAENEDIVYLQNSEGRASIHSKGDSIMYKILDSDILGYSESENSILQIGRYYHTDDLLELTSTSNYPDAMYRVSKLFQAIGAPDIVLLSKEGYDLAKDFEIFVGNYKGGHGGLHRDFLSVPFILSGPTVTVEKKSVMRSEEFGLILKEKLGI